MSARRRNVVLVTEGAYPYAQGGVTTWCDQLIRGLPEIEFTVAAVSGTGREEPVVALPDNVVEVQSIPVWGPPPGGRRAYGRRARRVVECQRALVEAMCADADADVHSEATDQFLAALRELQTLSPTYDVGRILRSEKTVMAVHDAMRAPRTRGRRERFVRETPLSDALTATDMMDHFLRALWKPPVRSGRGAGDDAPVVRGV